MTNRLRIDAFLSALSPAGPTPTLEGLAAAPTPAPDRLQWAYRAAGVVLDDVQAIEANAVMGEQLQSVQSLATDRAGLFTDVRGRIFDGVLALMDAPSGLQVDDELADRLPFLELATEIARMQPAGRLTVRLGAQGTGCGGIHSRQSVGGVILLSSELDESTLPETFAHELAHAVDPDLTTVDGEGKEAFAYHLGPAIVRERPTDLGQLAPLIADSLEATRCRRRPAIAAEDLEQLVTFVAVQVGALEPLADVDLIAAHRGDP